MNSDSDWTDSESRGDKAPLPECIGPYRILELLGEGGMSLVYLAEQSKPLVRRVALKVLKPGTDTRELLARFAFERQVLSQMSHSHIARIYDAGETEHGYPYFVMEYVPGRTLVDYCDHHRLGLRRRLDLFRDVCLAVQQAHQKGIIHRDLKPSNILVTIENEKPIPKIIDFGIAKAMTPTADDRRMNTQFGAVIGSMDYVSPEQSAGTLDLDTRTDIYSLGVVLYQLLIGALPLSLSLLSIADAETMIRNRDAPSLSAQLKNMGDMGVKAAEKRTRHWQRSNGMSPGI